MYYLFYKDYLFYIKIAPAITAKIILTIKEITMVFAPSLSSLVDLFSTAFS